MSLPDGGLMWGKWVYREIVAPERLVTIVSFSDENGGVTRHPLSAGWPLETLSSVSFDEVPAGTELTMRWASHNATELERETFNTSHDAMRQGCGGMLDQLAAYVASIESK